MNKKNTSNIKNEDGSAIVETLPLLIIFMTILGNMWGFFMAVHAGILSSIGARTYAFETFRNRADLTYFRDQKPDSGEPYGTDVNYYKVGARIHSVTSPGNSGKFYPLSVNYNKFSPAKARASNSIVDQHQHDTIFSPQVGKEFEGVKKIWIRSTYGICLNYAGCT